MKEPDKYYLIRFTAEGRSRFPLDMLRYDRCCPATESDTNTIAQSFEHHFPIDLKVNLTRFSRAGKSDPCVERWKSFGWNVSNIQYQE